MSFQKSLAFNETTLKDEYLPSLQSFHAYLEESRSEPFVGQQNGHEFRLGSFGLYCAVTAKLAKAANVNTRINFTSSDHGHAEEDRVIISFASQGEEQLFNQYADSRLGNENLGLVRGLFSGFNKQHNIAAFTAISADVDIEEVLAPYIHFNGADYASFQAAHKRLLRLHEIEPDLMKKYLLLENVRNYYYDLINGDSLLLESIRGLGLAIQAYSPSEARAARLEIEMTQAMSVKLFGKAQIITLEQLYIDGYRPLQPEEYSKWLKNTLEA